MARGDDIAYMFGNGQFGTLDLKTGAFSTIANLSNQLQGLGVANGKLYGSSQGSLFQVNLANGVLTLAAPQSKYRRH
jgi:hypothetical protein